MFGAGVLGLMLWVPPHEGCKAGAALADVYFKDPFVAYLYIGSIPFFAALWQAFMALGYAGRGEVFSPHMAKALGRIKYFALANAGVLAAAAAYIRITSAAGEDPAGFVMPAALAVFVSIAAAWAANAAEKKARGR